MHRPLRVQHKLIRFVVMMVVILAAFWSSPAPVSAQAKIDSRVLEDTANGQVAHFLVYLNRQADARGAAGMAHDRNGRGQAVLNALREAATSSPPAVRAQLGALGA